MNSPLIVIVGPTASGKSAAAIQIAKKLHGEIICADSQTIRHGMDIGTAKPTSEDQKQIEHHLLDIVEPNEAYNVAQFQRAAQAAIEAIASKGKVPVMVGGTGLYVDSVLFGYEFEGDTTDRDEVNPRHRKRSEPASTDMPLRPHTLVLGIDVDKELLSERIEARVAQMISAGLEKEVMTLAARYGWDSIGMKGVGYQEWQAYAEGAQTLDQTIDLIAVHTRQYAKRQRTWFKRNPHILWFQDAASARAYAEKWLIEQKNRL